MRERSVQHETKWSRQAALRNTYVRILDMETQFTRKSHSVCSLGLSRLSNGKPCKVPMPWPGAPRSLLATTSVHEGTTVFYPVHPGPTAGHLRSGAATKYSGMTSLSRCLGTHVHAFLLCVHLERDREVKGHTPAEQTLPNDGPKWTNEMILPSSHGRVPSAPSPSKANVKQTSLTPEVVAQLRRGAAASPLPPAVTRPTEQERCKES